MKQNKFTLLELLVVVAMIGILLTLLLPSLSKARELTKRAVCLSNLGQIYRGLAQYSNNSNGNIPAAQAALKISDGNYAIKASKTIYGHGYIYSTGIVTDPYLAECPSSTNPVHRVGSGSDAFRPPPASAQEKINKLRSHITSSYAYRSTFSGEGLNKKGKTIFAFRGPSFLLDEPGQILMSDHFTENYSVEFTHKEGHNGSYIDGSAAWNGNKGLLYLDLANSGRPAYTDHENLYWRTRDR